MPPKAKLPTLAYRHLGGGMIQVFKFSANIYDCELPPLFKFGTGGITRGHINNILVFSAST